ncbi:iron chaperone [Companilactobacillus sp. HBUAS59699]|uniref:iron chaperone n=1 Tax=Companilactobacillus sp. HBUAS59699 TaxID=3109358 RepID=UPI002FF14353
MDVFEEFLANIQDESHRKRMIEIIDWVQENFPNLKKRFAWRQPMFTDHGTFIIGFSVAQKHISVAPEGKWVELFATKAEDAGYSHGKEIFRIGFDQEVNYDLLKDVIEFNIEDKKDCDTFWRKK